MSDHQNGALGVLTAAHQLIEGAQVERAQAELEVVELD